MPVVTWQAGRKVWPERSWPSTRRRRITARIVTYILVQNVYIPVPELSIPYQNVSDKTAWWQIIWKSRSDSSRFFPCLHAREDDAYQIQTHTWRRYKCTQHTKYFASTCKCNIHPLNRKQVNIITDGRVPIRSCSAWRTCYYKITSKKKHSICWAYDGWTH